MNVAMIPARMMDDRRSGIAGRARARLDCPVATCSGYTNSDNGEREPFNRWLKNKAYEYGITTDNTWKDFQTAAGFDDIKKSVMKKRMLKEPKRHFQLGREHRKLIQEQERMP